MRLALQFAVAFLLAPASTPLWAPPPANAQCVSGSTPATVTTVYGERLELLAAPASLATQPGWAGFHVRDAAGNALRNVDVEFTLPASGRSGSFGLADGAEFFVDTDSKHATVRIGDSCYGTLPSFIVDAAPGTFTMTAQPAGTPGAATMIPVEILGDLGAITFTNVGTAANGIPPAEVAFTVVGPRATWNTARGSGPIGGLALDLSLSSSTFADGATSKRVVTNAMGAFPVDILTARAGSTVQLLAGTGTTRTEVAAIQSSVDPVMTMPSPPAQIWYGAREKLDTRTQLQSPSCRTESFKSPIAFRANGIELSDAYDGSGITFACPTQYVYADRTLAELPFGTHELTVSLGKASRTTAPLKTARVAVAPHFTSPLAGGGTLDLAVSDPLYPTSAGTCSLLARVGSFGDAGWPSQPPPNAQSVSALFRVDSANCDWKGLSNGFGFTFPPATLGRRVLVQRESDLPAGTVAWAYGPTADNATDHWYELRTSTSGRTAFFDIVDGGPGDQFTGTDGRILATVALAVPKHAAVPGRFQDLWWAGPQESGWGVSIVQHRDALFSELFVYDAEGKARWLVMPDGQWNAARTAYVASVYRPRAAPHYAYDVSRFQIGAPVGTATLRLLSPDNLRLEYTIDGVTGAKDLSRIPFGPMAASPMSRFDDLWWAGPAQNGWGLVLAQQNRKLFGLLYTYDANGDATWFVAPSIDGIPRPSFAGDLYRPSGARWLGVPYDASKHSVEKVGRLSVSFADGWEWGSLSYSVGTKRTVVTITRVPF